MIPSCLLLLSGLGLMIWLTPNPRMISTDVGLDVHSMLLGALLTILGYQTLWLWLFAKAYGTGSGMLPPDRVTRQVARCFKLERGLIIGVLMLAAGLAFNVWLSMEWWDRHLGPLDVTRTMRVALWGFVLIVLGVQTAYNSFFLSMIGMSGPGKGH